LIGVSVDFESTGQSSNRSLDCVRGDVSDVDRFSNVVDSKLPTKGQGATSRDSTDVDTSESMLTGSIISVNDTIVVAVTTTHTRADKGRRLDLQWVFIPSLSDSRSIDISGRLN